MPKITIAFDDEGDRGHIQTAIEMALEDEGLQYEPNGETIKIIKDEEED